MSAPGLAVDVVGWAGAVLLVVGYALVSSGRTSGQSPVFLSMNLAGACGLLANGLRHGAWPSAVLNLVWLVIGLAALARLRTANRQAPGQSTDSAGRDSGGVPH